MLLPSAKPAEFSTATPLDLTSTRQRLQASASNFAAELESYLELAQSAACAHAFVRLEPESARTAVAHRDCSALPLDGLSVLN